MAYPELPNNPEKIDLIEHFKLGIDDRSAIGRIRGDKNVLGFAILLKTFKYLGYPLQNKADLPDVVIGWIADQLQLQGELFQSYLSKGRTFKHHLSLVRELTGFRPYEGVDQSQISEWLIASGNKIPTREAMEQAAVLRFRELKIELTASAPFRRLVSSARHRFLEAVYETVSGRIELAKRQTMDQFLEGGENSPSRFDWMKSRPGRTGMKVILAEIEKLTAIRDLGLDPEQLFQGIAIKLVEGFAERARSEDTYLMQRHPDEVRYTLLAALLAARGREVTDNIVKVFLDLARRIEKKADQSLETALVREIKKVYRKRRILYQIAVAATSDPKGAVSEVLFPVVGEGVFQRIIEEFEGTETRYEHCRIQVMKKKYGGHCRRMMKPILDILTFRANNPAFQPVLDGLALVHDHIDRRSSCYPSDTEIPEGLLDGKWRDLAIEDRPKGPRIIKQYFELCVLRKLERGLKTKEIWVEGAYRYRNPDRDLPTDWSAGRVEYCRKLDIPLHVEEFVDPIRQQMTTSLQEANRYLSRKRDVYIYFPGGGERGLLRIPKPSKQKQRPLLAEIKKFISDRWGVVDLVDILIEADRQANFTRFFRTTGQRQVMSFEEARERWLLCVFSLGTCTGLKRVHAAAQPSLLLRRPSLFPPALRQQLGAA